MVGSTFEIEMSCGSPNFSGLDLVMSFAFNADRRVGVDTEVVSGTTVDG